MPRSTLRWLPSHTLVWITAFAVVAAPAVVTAGARGALGRFSPRGDATCDFARTAADAVASVRALEGGTLCTGADCDRNGTVTPADVRCSVGCLFGVCPVPPHGSRVTAAAPDSAPAIVPFSVIRVTVDNIDSERLKGATIGGNEAGVVEFIEPDTLDLVVPDVEPGEADLVVIDGDLAGVPFPITVRPLAPVGEPDSFEDLTLLVADMLGRFAELPIIDEVYGDRAGFLRAELETYRERLAGLFSELEADPEFTDDVAAHLDAVADGSGLPDEVRDAIAEIELAATTAGSPPGSDARRLGGGAVELERRAVQVTGRATARFATVAAGLSLGQLVALAATGVLLGALIPEIASLVPGVDQPWITSTDPEFPRVDKLVELRGAELGSSPVLDIKSRRKEWTGVPAESAEENSAEYILRNPAEVFDDICGRVEFTLRRPILGTKSAAYPVHIMPDIVGQTAPSVKVGQFLQIDTRGAVSCDPTILFEGPVTMKVTPSFVSEDAILGFFTVLHHRVRVPPGAYTVRLGTNGGPLLSDAVQVQVDAPEIEIHCAETQLVVSPGKPSVTLCGVRVLSEGVQLSHTTEFEWTSSDPAIIQVESGGAVVGVGALGPGIARIGVAVFLVVEIERTGSPLPERMRFPLASAEAFSIRVRDETRPTVRLTSAPAPGDVTPGTTIDVGLFANDNAGVDRVRLTATGEAVINEEPREVLCDRTDRCHADFFVELRETAPSDGRVVIRGEAFDTAGNMSAEGEAELEFTVVRPTGSITGVVSAEGVAQNSPLEGATVLTFDADGKFIANTRSASDGRFRFEDVPTGPITVTAIQDGFNVGNVTAQVRAGQTADVGITLSPIGQVCGNRAGVDARGRRGMCVEEGAWVVGTARQIEVSVVEGDEPAEEVIVSVFDSALERVGAAVSGPDGTYEARGLPVGEPLLIRAVKPGFASASTSSRPLFLDESAQRDFLLYPTNPACQSDLGRFEVTRGTILIFGQEIVLGEADVADELSRNRFETHPDAAVLCVSTDGRRPTFRWSAEWLEEVGTSSRFLDVEEEVAGRENVFTPIFRLRATDPAGLVPPVTYGDDSEGTVSDLGFPTPDLRDDGTLYRLTMVGVELQFRVRP